MNVKTAFLGMADGNFRGTPGDEEIRQRVLRSPNYPGIHAVLRTRCNFTTNIGRDDDGHLWTEGGNRKTFIPRSEIDGIVSHGECGIALAIANADCPVIRIWNNTEALNAIVHGALRCLVPSDGKSRGILQAFCEDMHQPTPSTHASIEFGIGTCCYGLEHPPECTPNALIGNWPGDESHVATNGPRAGWRSFDLRRIARMQLALLGFTPDNIHDDRETMSCTACITGPGGGYLYHSNVRDAAAAGRNLAVTWREMSIEKKKPR